MAKDVKGDKKSTGGGGYVPTRAELDAIRQVETGGCSDPLTAVGDGGALYWTVPDHGGLPR